MKNFINYYMNHPDYVEIMFNALGPERPPSGYKVFAERATGGKYFWVTKDVDRDEMYQCPPYAFVGAWEHFYRFCRGGI